MVLLWTIFKTLCFADAEPVVHEETGPSEENLFSGKCIIDPNESPTKNVKPVTSLHKILKFRLITDAETPDLGEQNTTPPS